MHIRPAVAVDSPRLQAIERAGGELFRAIGMPEIADDEPFSVDELEAWAIAGHSWVAVEGDLVTAYMVVDLLTNSVHIEQVTVDPAYSRRGHGAALIERADAYARTVGRPALTLTTFTDVAWNAPYYERLGFRTISATEMDQELLRVRETEAQHGLDRWPRVCMIRPVG